MDLRILTAVYQARQSDRPREGEAWNMPGCLPDDSFVNS
jgi:hypothetical protein